jgi:hypothetical protein
MVLLFRGLFGLVCLAVVAQSASAVWVTIKNETDKVVIVQEARSVNGKLVKGKEYCLAPGELLKEFQTAAGEKIVLVSEKDSQVAPAKVKLHWGKEDAAFAVTKDGTDVKLGPSKGK